jgi:hypothetical protein
MPICSSTRLANRPRWVKTRILLRPEALAASDKAAVIAARSCASNICASAPSSTVVCASGSPEAGVAGLSAAPSPSSPLPSPASPSSSFAAGGASKSGCVKNASKQAASAAFSSPDFAMVSSSTSRRMARSPGPTSAAARIASMLSAGEILTPAPRAARKKRCSTSRIRPDPSQPSLRGA